ncbi:DNA/RNA non-specific endonuclease [Micromonospora sp. NBC_00898]|uniref:DNA/RNA non-specific endonuclease n=1 Tax=Micromonospora sp. NBC_00898 TaxID=2975981 RepID=UPI00386D75FA
MHSGHLIARSLGGAGASSDPNAPKNLVPLYKTVNTPVMYWTVENYVTQRVKTGETVYYQVSPLYSGSNPVPYAVKAYVAGDRFGSQTFVFENSPFAYQPLPARR